MEIQQGSVLHQGLMLAFRQVQPALCHHVPNGSVLPFPQGVKCHDFQILIGTPHNIVPPSWRCVCCKFLLFLMFLPAFSQQEQTERIILHIISLIYSKNNTLYIVIN